MCVLLECRGAGPNSSPSSSITLLTYNSLTECCRHFAGRSLIQSSSYLAMPFIGAPPPPPPPPSCESVWIQGGGYTHTQHTQTHTHTQHTQTHTHTHNTHTHNTHTQHAHTTCTHTQHTHTHKHTHTHLHTHTHCAWISDTQGTIM